MPAISSLPIKALRSQFSKRDHPHNQGGDHSNVGGPVVMVGLVIAALTLLAAIVPLFRSPRFRRWVFSSSIPTSIKFYNPARKALGVITPPNPAPMTTTAKEDLGAISIAEIPITSPVLIYNDYSNTYFVGSYSNTSSNCHDVTTREDGRMPRAEEPLEPRRPERAVTWRFS